MHKLNLFLCLMVWIIRPVIPVPDQPASFLVRYHPDGGLRVDDQVSLEIFAPPGYWQREAKIRVVVFDPQEHSLGEAQLVPDGIGGQSATLLWAWDTRDLSPGTYRFRFSLVAGFLVWEQSVELQPSLAGEPAVWLERETECCRLHYISGTDAERDIPMLAQVVDERARRAALWLQAAELDSPAVARPPAKKLDVNLVPRVLGQGGFAGDEVTVSYSDRNYITGDPLMLIQHELIHRIDASLGGDLRPLILVEGLAVYLSGGHYQSEPIFLRAAGLVQPGGDYIPLPALAENFYSHQHEISYLEAAALTGYMVSTWGWEAYARFYRDIHPAASQKVGDALDAALRVHFGLSLAELDGDFSDWLASLPLLPDLQKDLELTVAYYDMIRAYQMDCDPSAYFRQVWLPDAATMRQRQIVADYLRGPQAPLNSNLETLLQQAGHAWRAGRYPEARQLLKQVRLKISSD